MNEIEEVFLDDPAYSSTSYESDWLEVSSISYLIFSAYSVGSNFTMKIEYAVDRNYVVISTDSEAVTAGNFNSMHSKVVCKYAKLSITGFTSGQDLKVQAFLNNTDANGRNISLTSDGMGISLVADSVGPDLKTKSVYAGSGIAIVDGPSDLTITNTAELNNIGVGTINLVKEGLPPAYEIHRLGAGTGISLGYDPNDGVIVTNNASISSVGTGSSLVVKGTPNYTIKSLVQGSGIILSNNVNDITITNGVDYNTAYGNIYDNSPSNTISLTDTPTLLAPVCSIDPLFNFTGVDGILTYTDVVNRYIYVEFDMDISPTDLTHNFIFELRKNGTDVIDTRTTFTNGSYEHISLQSLENLTNGDTISVFIYHDNVGGPSINTTMNYYNLICTHQQFASEQALTSAQVSASVSRTYPRTNVLNVIDLDVYSPTRSDLLVNLVTNTLTFTATGIYTFNYFGSCTSNNQHRLYVNGVLTVTSSTFPSGPFASSYSNIAITAGSTVQFVFLDGGSGTMVLSSYYCNIVN